MKNLPPRPTTFIEVSEVIPRSELRIVLASETFQHTGSFKYRAAYQVARNAPHGHIITASSGNYGQALALACRVFGKQCTVVMPNTSAKVKVDAVASHGATVDLIDVSQISREGRIANLASEFPDAYITSAFDDPWVIAGNSTLGIEILEKYPHVQSILAPVGGGGLTSGIAKAVQEHNRKVSVVGAEPAMANDAARSLREGRIIVNDHEPQTLADGARTRSLGWRNWEILHTQGGLSDIIEVSEDTICEAVRLLFLKANLKVEPTGALAFGAVLTAPERFMHGGLICCVVSGGNVDPLVYSKILMG